MIIASRHVHHLYDACVLEAASARPVQFLVALDWISRRGVRRLMEWACDLAGWPVVLRTRPPRPASRADAGGTGNIRHRPTTSRKAGGGAEGLRYPRRALRGAVALLRAGEALAVFPEAYPNIDPGYTPKTGDHDFLPFRPGFARLAVMAERDGQTRVPIVPAGLSYERGGRWRVTLRFGAPLFAADWNNEESTLSDAVEARVRQLSGWSTSPDSTI